MICPTDSQRVFHYLGITCAVSIIYRAMGIPLVDVICQLFGRSDVVVMRNPEIMPQLITLAGLLIGAMGANKYMDSKNQKRDTNLRTRKTDQE